MVREGAVAELLLPSHSISLHVCRETTLKNDLPWEFLSEWFGLPTPKSLFLQHVSEHLVAVTKASPVYAAYGFLVPDVIAAAGELLAMRCDGTVLLAVATDVTHSVNSLCARCSVSCLQWRVTAASSQSNHAWGCLWSWPGL